MTMEQKVKNKSPYKVVKNSCTEDEDVLYYVSNADTREVLHNLGLDQNAAQEEWNSS